MDAVARRGRCLRGPNGVRQTRERRPAVYPAAERLAGFTRTECDVRRRAALDRAIRNPGEDRHGRRRGAVDGPGEGRRSTCPGAGASADDGEGVRGLTQTDVALRARACGLLAVERAGVLR